jgi:hypothetical protein
MLPGLTECDVVIRRQKIGPDQAPSGRQYVEILHGKSICQPPVDIVCIEPIGGVQAKRISCVIVVREQHLPPGPPKSGAQAGLRFGLASTEVHCLRVTYAVYGIMPYSA